MRIKTPLAVAFVVALSSAIFVHDGLAAKKTKSGAHAGPDVGSSLIIKFKAVDGQSVDLSTMTGKVVLVDFWATWCGPCVGELPNVKAAYGKFHDKGFEIIGISLDDDKSTLKKFIKKQEMPWPQACSGAGWEDPMVKKYRITGIPATFLVGKDGKIAATDLRGPGELEAKLAELLK